MAWVNVLAGSFIAGTGHHYSDGRFRLLTTASPHAGEDIPVTELIELSPADPRSERLVGFGSSTRNPLQWLASPFRVITRLLPQDPKTQVSFQAKFKDGRRMIATTDIKTFREIDKAVENGATEDTQANIASNVATLSPASFRAAATGKPSRSSAAAAFSPRKDIEQTVSRSDDDGRRRDSAKVTPLRKV